MPSLDGIQGVGEFRVGDLNGGIERDQVSFGGDDFAAQEFIWGSRCGVGQCLGGLVGAPGDQARGNRAEQHRPPGWKWRRGGLRA